MSLKHLPRLLFGVGCCLLPLSLPPSAARAAAGSSSGSQIDVNFFYDSLKDQGSWFNTTEYGDVWQPYIAYKSDSWRPYTDGYWCYTDGGWMFVSNESFGWAVYHYGRWTKLQDIGWAWVPGTEWAPAWVTWRESKPGDASGAPAADAPVSATTTDANPPPPAPDAAPPVPAASSGDRPPVGVAASENYIGWAPLPPEPIAYGADYSYGPAVDVNFGIDPYAYVFTDYRSFGSPWIAGVIFSPDRGYYCCDHSVNITNVYYDRGGGRGYQGYYNGGPDFNRFRGVTERPIPQLALNRTTRASLAREQIRNGQFNRINGNQINVAAPRFSHANVRDGRVNFTQRGALPVTPVARQFAPAAAADNPAYKQARESFTRQGEAYRSQHPEASRGGPQNVPNAAPGAGGNSRAEGIATTPRAQQEERAARRTAERQGGRGGNPAPEANAERRSEAAPRAAGTASAERESRREARRSSASAARSEGSGREVRRQREAAPRVERAAPRVERGGGGEVVVVVAGAAVAAVNAPGSAKAAAARRKRSSAPCSPGPGYSRGTVMPRCFMYLPARSA